MTYYWPSASDRGVSEVQSDGSKFRVLLRFDNLHDYLPQGANVTQARAWLLGVGSGAKSGVAASECTTAVRTRTRDLTHIRTYAHSHVYTYAHPMHRPP